MDGGRVWLFAHSPEIERRFRRQVAERQILSWGSTVSHEARMALALRVVIHAGGDRDQVTRDPAAALRLSIGDLSLPQVEELAAEVTLLRISRSSSAL
jgi:hypothetical protein